MEYLENNFTAPPNSDKFVMWRFLRNRRLILRLHRPTVFRALTYWAHHAVILAIVWFSCCVYSHFWYTWVHTWCRCACHVFRCRSQRVSSAEEHIGIAVSGWYSTSRRL